MVLYGTGTHHSFLADNRSEVLKNCGHSHARFHLRQPHTYAVSGAQAKRQVSERVAVGSSFGREPVNQHSSFSVRLSSLSFSFSFFPLFYQISIDIYNVNHIEHTQII